MGTVGVLSYVPSATNAIGPLGSSLPLAGSTTHKAAPAATTHKAAPAATATNRTQKATSAAKGKAARVAKTMHKPVAPTTSMATRNISGGVAQTPFGPIQVQITVKGKQIIAARALQTPQGGYSSQVNQQAVPYLVQETLAAQSARIQGVGGATYTSQGWAQSLQSAISKI